MSGLGPIHFVTRHRTHLCRVPAGTRSFRHPHHIIALHRVEGGHAGLADERVAVTGAFLVLLPAGDLDANDMVGHDDAWWCAFDSAAVVSEHGGARVVMHSVDRTLPRLHPVDAAGARRAAGFFLDLRAAHEAGTPAGAVTALARLADLLAFWLETGAETRDDAVDGLRELLERHACDANVSLTALAHHLGRSTESVSKAFRRRYGRTPIAHRTALRIQRARELLADRTRPLVQVAAACGMPDVGYFCRVFRRYTGNTPGQWVRRFAGSDGHSYHIAVICQNKSMDHACTPVHPRAGPSIPIAGPSSRMPHHG